MRNLHPRAIVGAYIKALVHSIMTPLLQHHDACHDNHTQRVVTIVMRVGRSIGSIRSCMYPIRYQQP
jgi:hypothetical protein